MRRAGVRRQRIIETSDEEELSDIENRPPANNIEEEDHDEYTPAPKFTSRLNRNNMSERSATSLTPMTAQAPNGHQAKQNDTGVCSSPVSATPSAKRRMQTTRKSVRASRKSMITSQTDKTSTDEISSARSDNASGNPTRSPAATNPSTDTDSTTLNVQPANEASLTHSSVKLETPSQPLEKPMDIVVRTRAKALPQIHEDSTCKARMVINYLILTNFKSYAGRQEVGPFHASFSSVVGPNGSGKSNVIDSLLFVFGFRASKMRQGKISSLIHQSAHYPNLDFCEVQVQFQQVVDYSSGSKEIVPDSNLTIARRAFKNNSSKYYINENESNFTAVTTLLKQHGVDLDHKRFLILQGEVESIAQMKPKAANEHDDGLLEYLEDIIGTSKYKTPIEESATETDALNEICREKHSRVQHVEKEKNALESKKDAALAYINDENELANKQSTLWQVFVHECEDNVQVTEEAISQIQEQLSTEVDKHQGAENEITRLSKQYASEVKHFERLQHNTQTILKQLTKADKETVKFEEKRNHLNNKLKKLEKAKSTSEAAISESSANLLRLGDNLSRNNSNILDLEQQLQQEQASLTAIRESLHGKTEGLSNEIETKQKQLSPWQEQIAEKQAAIDVAQSELDMLRERDNAGAQAITDIEARLSLLREERAAKAASAEEFRNKGAGAQVEMAEMQKKLDKLVTQEPNLRVSLSTSRQRVDEAKASLVNSQSRGNVLDGLMRLKDSGRISGFHGRLGNLGTIDQKYDVAISTACPALDNLVVDSVEVGQQCIDFLRKNNLGRANFILLDRLNKRDFTGIETPENVPRLFDLVKPKHDRFLPAFYSVLQDSLVANDLGQANRVAYGARRWRVVTLEGQLIDKSGTMSGGGTRVAKGAMSAKLVADTSKDQVAKLESEHENQEQVFADFQREKQSLEASVKARGDFIPQTETSVSKALLEVESIERNIKDAEKRVSELSCSSQPAKTDGRDGKLMKEITRLEQQIRDLSKNTSGLEEDIRMLQERIMEVGGVKLRGQKAKVDGLKEQIKTLQEEISGAEVDQTKHEKSKEKHEKGRDEAAKEIDAMGQEVSQLDEDVAQQALHLSGSKKEAEQAQEALEAKKDDMEILKAELDRRTGEVRETKGVEIEIRNQLEENQKALSENIKRLKYWQEKISKLVIQNVR